MVRKSTERLLISMALHVGGENIQTRRSAIRSPFIFYVVFIVDIYTYSEFFINFDFRLKKNFKKKNFPFTKFSLTQMKDFYSPVARYRFVVWKWHINFFLPFYIAFNFPLIKCVHLFLFYQWNIKQFYIFLSILDILTLKPCDKLS